MTNSERRKILYKQADLLHREAGDLKSRTDSGSIVIRHVLFGPEELKSIADRLEAMSKHVKSVADDIDAECRQ
jgi:hypothetical protein